MQFLYPNVLFLMLVPVLLLMFLIITNKDSFQKYFSKEILSKLSIANKYMGKTTRNIILFLSLILLVVALARPVANEKEQSFKQEVASIVVAIDVSKSMLATDLYPNRLSFAKQKLLNLIELSKKNAIAVILFAKSSFILSPVTQDFSSLKILVENLNPGINFDNGSNIFSTLETTNKLLKDYKSKNLILLTDGGNKDTYKDEIEYAKNNKINVYTIAIGTKKPAPIKLSDGNFLTKKDGSIVTVKVNDNVKKLSLNTQGGFINYSNSNDDIKQILDDIDIKSSKKEMESKKFKTYTELFYYPLAAGIFLLLIAFSSLPNLKRGANIAVLFTLLLLNSDLKAFEFDFKNIDKANDYYEKGEYKEAIKEYEKVAKTPEAKYNLANSYYKNGEYKKALKSYKQVVSSNKDLEHKKLHNLGNTYVKLNDLENAKKMYENALKIEADKETRENLEMIEKLLKKRKNKENKKQQNQNNQNNNNQQKNSKQKENQHNQEDKQNKENRAQENKKNQNSKQKEENKKNQDLKNSNSNSNKKEKIKQQSEKEVKQNQISDLEEKKWLEELEKDKTPVLLKKVESQKEDDSSTPW
ncbi:tetratricopeptide repeat protein [Halarcobacter anaerophilus]|uniref:tetratricopeptide repeat protein n=1 Tax=Halarcobacter anaerophilus TaxID=877500 RepID=UPI000B0B46F9|nr:tetratricopeptide repeat protein [Halarcobacter anaerophilus]